MPHLILATKKTKGKSLFISYRREDTSGYAGRLFETLRGHIGRERLFMDVDTIRPGEDFLEVIERTVGSCDGLIVLIGPRWLSATDEDGRTRLEDSEDFVRREIKTALDRGLKVIPVLVEGAEMPGAEHLPDELAPLARRHAAHLSHEHWQADVEYLVRSLELERRRFTLWVAAAAVALLAALGGFFAFRLVAQAPEGEERASEEDQGGAPASPGGISPTALDSAGDVGEHTSVTIGPDGFPVVSYYDARNGDLKVVRCTTPSCSSSDPPTVVDTAGDVGEYSSVAIGSDGFPVVSYYDTRNGGLKVVHCTTPSCSSFDPPTAVDTAGDVGEYSSVAVAADGYPVVSYYDARNGDLKVVHCTTPSCSAFDRPTAVDTAGDVGMFSSIAIGFDGLPMMSYRDAGKGDLKVIHCTTPSCSSSDSPTAVDTAGDVGMFSSIAIGPDGLPVVSYYDSANGDLKVLHCTTPACSSFDPPTAVDTAGDVGMFSSIAIAPDGFPLVSYRDVGKRSLKVVHVVAES